MPHINPSAKHHLEASDAVLKMDTPPPRVFSLSMWTVAGIALSVFLWSALANISPRRQSLRIALLARYAMAIKYLRS
jgi:hypothetical protein